MTSLSGKQSASTSTGPALHHDSEENGAAPDDQLPRWSIADAHESLESRSFTDAMERSASSVDRLVTLFDQHNVDAAESRSPTAGDGVAADEVLIAFNRTMEELGTLGACIYASVSTNSRDSRAQKLMSELEQSETKFSPLLARLADWVRSFDPTALAEHSEQAREHIGPLLRLAERSTHQMTEKEENLFAELSSTGAGAWSRLQRDITSQLTTTVAFPEGDQELPMPAVRGLATNPDVRVRKAAYDAELEAWPKVELSVSAALNAIKGEANAVNRRRNWDKPVDASLFANSVGQSTFAAMQSAITDSLPDFQQWMRVKANLHRSLDAPLPGSSGKTDGGLEWWNLVAPIPVGASSLSWDDGLDIVENAFSAYSPNLGGIVGRAIKEEWIDAEPRDGKSGGAFCMPFFGDRSLVLLNWSGSTESAQTTAHELGHAYHNTTLADRTALQRRLPMALAETASIFCETLVVEEGLSRLSGQERLALLEVDLQGSNQVVVDIRSRFLFETELFERRNKGVLSSDELCEMMLDAQSKAYGAGLDQETAHPYMWLLKGHYYGSHFYNWPYTYGMLFGLGLYARYQEDPEKFRSGYDTLLSRAGMDTAEELGQAFDLDVTDEGFWTASLDVIRTRMVDYESLAADVIAANTTA